MDGFCPTAESVALPDIALRFHNENKPSKEDARMSSLVHRFVGTLPQM